MVEAPEVAALPAGPYRLVDNRIVAGESSWVGQPVTLCTIHPKQNKPEHRAFIRALLEKLNGNAKALTAPVCQAIE